MQYARRKLDSDRVQKLLQYVRMYRADAKERLLENYSALTGWHPDKTQVALCVDIPPFCLYDDVRCYIYADEVMPWRLKMWGTLDDYPIWDDTLWPWNIRFGNVRVLTRDIVHCIARHLTPREKLNMAKVCFSWYRAISVEACWLPSPSIAVWPILKRMYKTTFRVYTRMAQMLEEKRNLIDLEKRWMWLALCCTLSHQDDILIPRARESLPDGLQQEVEVLYKNEQSVRMVRYKKCRNMEIISNGEHVKFTPHHFRVILACLLHGSFPATIPKIK